MLPPHDVVPSPLASSPRTEQIYLLTATWKKRLGSPTTSGELLGPLLAGGAERAESFKKFHAWSTLGPTPSSLKGVQGSSLYKGDFVAKEKVDAVENEECFAARRHQSTTLAKKVPVKPMDSQYGENFRRPRGPHAVRTTIPAHLAKEARLTPLQVLDDLPCPSMTHTQEELAQAWPADGQNFAKGRLRRPPDGYEKPGFGHRRGNPWASKHAARLLHTTPPIPPRRPRAAWGSASGASEFRPGSVDSSARAAGSVRDGVPWHHRSHPALLEVPAEALPGVPSKRASGKP